MLVIQMLEARDPEEEAGCQYDRLVKYQSPAYIAVTEELFFQGSRQT